MAININRNVLDPFYRYKMPRLQAKVTYDSSKIKDVLLHNFRIFQVIFNILQVEGKGNGIKTVIANMTEIAKALERPPTCKHLVS